MFFNEVVGKKNKHKNRKAIWFEYIYSNQIAYLVALKKYEKTEIGILTSQ
jgi:hypothetical protein